MGKPGRGKMVIVCAQKIDAPSPLMLRCNNYWFCKIEMMSKYYPLTFCFNRYM